MSKPDDIPHDVWATAQEVALTIPDLEAEVKVARAILAERNRCLLRVAEQRCERGTPWDLAVTTCMNAIKPGSAVFVAKEPA